MWLDLGDPNRLALLSKSIRQMLQKKKQDFVDRNTILNFTAGFSIRVANDQRNRIWNLQY